MDFNKDEISPYLRVSIPCEVVSSSMQEGQLLYLVRDREKADDQYYVKSLLKLPRNFKTCQITSASHSFKFVETGFHTRSFGDSRLEKQGSSVNAGSGQSAERRPKVVRY